MEKQHTFVTWMCHTKNSKTDQSDQTNLISIGALSCPDFLKNMYGK
jgi:hypothetical protein